MGKIRRRCRGDAGEMQGRYGGDAGEMPHLEVCVLEGGEELAERSEQHRRDGRAW